MQAATEELNALNFGAEQPFAALHLKRKEAAAIESSGRMGQLKLRA